jgi:hypothetical protein
MPQPVLVVCVDHAGSCWPARVAGQGSLGSNPMSRPAVPCASAHVNPAPLMVGPPGTMVWFGMVSTIGQPDLVNGRPGNKDRRLRPSTANRKARMP